MSHVKNSKLHLGVLNSGNCTSSRKLI